MLIEQVIKFQLRCAKVPRSYVCSTTDFYDKTVI